MIILIFCRSLFAQNCRHIKAFCHILPAKKCFECNILINIKIWKFSHKALWPIFFRDDWWSCRDIALALFTTGSPNPTFLGWKGLWANSRLSNNKPYPPQRFFCGYYLSPNCKSTKRGEWWIILSGFLVPCLVAWNPRPDGHRALMYELCFTLKHSSSIISQERCCFFRGETRMTFVTKNRGAFYVT